MYVLGLYCYPLSQLYYLFSKFRFFDRLCSDRFRVSFIFAKLSSVFIGRVWFFADAGLLLSVLEITLTKKRNLYADLSTGCESIAS